MTNERFVLTSLSRHNRGMKDEYDKWYDEHVRCFLPVPSILSAQRFVKVDSVGGDFYPPRHYLALYEIETSSLDSTLEDLYAASVDTVVSEELFTSGDYSFTHIFWKGLSEEKPQKEFRKGSGGELIGTTFIEATQGVDAEFEKWISEPGEHRYQKCKLTTPDDPVLDFLLLSECMRTDSKSCAQDVSLSCPEAVKVGYTVIWRAISEKLTNED